MLMCLRFRRLVSSVVLPGTILLQACSTEGEAIETAPPLDEEARMMMKRLELAAQLSFIDDDGYRWVKVKDVEYKSAPSEIPKHDGSSLPHVKPLYEMSLEEATEAVRPVQEFANAEFVMDDDSARRLATLLQQVARERADTGDESASPGEGPLVEGAPPQQLEVKRNFSPRPVVT